MWRIRPVTKVNQLFTMVFRAPPQVAPRGAGMGDRRKEEMAFVLTIAAGAARTRKKIL